MLLIVPATICVAILVLHSLYFRPLRATKLFFLFAVPGSMIYGGADFYIFNVKTPSIIFGAIPVMNMIGFIFTFYCALSISIHIFEDFQGRRQVPFFKLLFSIIYFSAFIGIAIEYTNRVAGWWTWQRETHFLHLFSVWCWRSMLIFPLLLQFFIPPRTRAKRAFIYSVIWFIFFFSWMLYVDKFPFLPPFTLVLWLLLPILAYTIKGPMVALKHLQFNRPVPLLPRLRSRRSRNSSQRKTEDY